MCELSRRLLCIAAGALLLSIAAPASADANWKYRFEPAAGITASGQPTADGISELADSDYAAVIDLRTADEERGLNEKETVENLGMDYISLPIAGRDAINFENAEKLEEILKGYDQPVLIHCGSGNRVGALLALQQKINGAEDEDALAFGRSAGLTSLEDTVRARLRGE